MLINFNNVTKKYSSKLALDDISFEITKGKVIGLLGPNGSGKTTIIKLINGLIQPTKGEILIQGKPLNYMTHNDIAYLPERTYLNNWMTVNQLLKFFSDFYENFDNDYAMTMLTELGINAADKLATMSKGTKEKVQLILVMARRAKIYILDEPIGGVDPAARDYILNTIIKSYSTESTLIIATHLIQEVESICDEIMFIHNGTITLSGNVDDLREEYNKSIDEIFREVFKC
ncbi:MAG: ABC transporter [Epulopiscium sp. Nuni2H_MBin003]|nr:MAG: ABC transporter [Epulopiscium sp. Nuni2H_MBin003]